MDFQFPGFSITIAHHQQQEKQQQQEQQQWEQGDKAAAASSGRTAAAAAGAAASAPAPPRDAREDLLADLQDLSGEQEDVEAEEVDAEINHSASDHGAAPEPSGGDADRVSTVQQEQQARRRGGAALPVEVLLLVLGAPGIGVRELVAGMCVCSDWRAAVAGSGGLWAGPLRAALPCTAAPTTAAPSTAAEDAAASREAGAVAPWILPPGLVPPSPLLHLKAWRAVSRATAGFGCLRKGFEFVADAFGAICVAATAAAAASGSGGGGRCGGAGQEQSRRITHVDQLWDEAPAGGDRLTLDDRYNARAVQRMVGKLAAQDWQLAYSGYCALVEAKAEAIAEELRAALEAARSTHSTAAATSAAAATAMTAPGGSSGQQGGWAAGGPLRGGLLARMERAMEGATARIAAEPEVLLASCGQGPRPEAGIFVCELLLAQWAVYRRCLDLFVARCGPLGARIEAARQEVLAGPALRISGVGGPLTIPHLLNRGLLAFRSRVVLAYGLRRPLQAALGWLGARARTGNEDLLSASDAALLERAARALTELDVWDDVTQPPEQHTHEKFRAAFGALLLRDRAAERHGLRER